MVHSARLHELVQAAQEQTNELSVLEKLLTLCLTAIQQSHTIVCNSIGQGENMNTLRITETQITFSPGNFIHLPSSRRRRKLRLPYMYWCAICNEVVMTKKLEEELDRCTKCGSPRWRGNHTRDRRHADWSQGMETPHEAS